MVLLVSSLASAGSLLVDGSLSDWGITVQDGNGSNISGYTGLAGIGLLGWMSEDTDDLSPHTSYLGPNYGGQDYDAEFMGVAVQGDRLFLAIVSGQRPDNGFKYYAPGDIRIETAAGIFGIEVGGGAGAESVTQGAIRQDDPGTTYALDGHGYTTGVESNPTQAAGSVWQDATWRLDPIAPGENVQQITGGTLVGTADYYFTWNTVGGQHSIIELSIPLSYLGGLHQPTKFFWRPSCGNDELHVGPVHLPLPGAFVPGLIALTVLGVGAAIRRRRRQAAA